MTNVRSLLLASAASLIAMTATTFAADQLLSGTITSATGEKLGGVTVSARKEGSTIATSVYTDEAGAYYFPPLPEGKYRVWAQALGFELSRSEVDLSAAKQQNLTLAAMTDNERRWRQLPGELMVASLPEETNQDARMKKIFMNQCTGCHTPSYTLQFRFDEAGWNKIINLMKTVNNRGVPQPDQKNQIIDLNQAELAAYLAKVRGPGESPIKIKERPRPVGEAARVVWQLYDVPQNADIGIGTQYQVQDGSEWALGTPSYLTLIMHDGSMDFDGNIWFTSNALNKNVTLGRIDAKTGEVKHFKVNRSDGLRAANAHGLTRDGEGNLWFDVDTGRRGLGKMEPKNEKITVYQTPNNMSPLGGAVTLDVDGKGMVWASAPDGVLRFDPKEERFTQFKSRNFKRVNGTSNTYGAAGDRDGNGWWAQMGWDTIGKALPDGSTIEIKLPELKAEMDKLTPAQLGAYEKVTDLSNGNPLPWGQGPRRMGTDKNADVLWVGNSWGSSFARIDTKTNEVTIVPFPDKAMQAYHIHVDSKHNVWGNLWTNDQVVKYDPTAGKWTLFEMPVRGTESRHVSVDERNGVTKVILPTYRSHQMFVMTLRSEADIAALKAQGAR